MDEQFKKQLFQAASARLNTRGIPVTNFISSNLNEVINAGVGNMTSLDLNTPSKRQLAEKNMIILVDAFVQRSVNEGLQTRTFSNARKSICPLWPFC